MSNPNPRPSGYPDWATNANFSTGPDVGTPTQVVVPAGRIADGWIKDIAPPPQYQNKWQGDVGKWMRYVDTGGGNPDRGKLVGRTVVTTTAAGSYAVLASFGTGLATFNIGDLIRVNINGVAWCIQDFFLDAFAAEGAGSDQLVTIGDISAPKYAGAPSLAGGVTRKQAVDLSFIWEMQSAQTFNVRIKGYAPGLGGGNTLSLAFGYDWQALRLS